MMVTVGDRIEHVDACPRPSRLTWILLTAILALSGAVHLIGWHRDLPSPEPDEPYFVLPAVKMASQGSLDPHWFGHPGSTVIVPLALAYRATDVVLHGGPIVGASRSIETRFRESPSDFFLLGRLWTVLLSVASVAALFLLGRLLWGDAAGLVAAGLYALVPLVVNYGRIVRSDSAGACFGLLALCAIVVMAERPTARQYAVAGAAIGLAVASRYFLIVLLPVAAVVWFTSRAEGRRPRPTLLLLLGGGALALFALLTPYFFLDWKSVSESLQAETVGQIGNTGFSFLDNVSYYFADAIPDAVGWAAYVAALCGIGIVLLRRDRRAMIPLGFAVAFTLAISTSSLHWPRWIIPVLPVLMLFAARALLLAARQVTRAASLPDDDRIGRVVVAGGLVAVAALVPAIALVRLERTAVTPSTRELMRAWIIKHVPPGTPVAQEVKGPELRSAGYPVLARYDLPADGTVADYIAHGYHYLVVNAYIALDYRLAHERFPEYAAFYNFLRRHGQLLHDERADGDRRGPHLKLYKVDVAQLAAARGNVDQVTTFKTKHDHLRHPKPIYPVGDELLH
jgi:hypothetical protein